MALLIKTSLVLASKDIRSVAIAYEMPEALK